MILDCIYTGCSFYLSPASLEFAEGAEKVESIFEKSLRRRFFKRTHASGGVLIAERKIFFGRFALLGGYPLYLVWPPGLGERVFQRYSGLRIRA